MKKIIFSMLLTYTCFANAELQPNTYVCDDGEPFEIIVTSNNIELDGDVFDFKVNKWTDLDSDTNYKVIKYSNQISVLFENILEDDELKSHSITAFSITKDIDGNYSSTFSTVALGENIQSSDTDQPSAGSITVPCKIK